MAVLVEDERGGGVPQEHAAQAIADAACVVKRAGGRALSQHGLVVFGLYKIWDKRVKPVVWLGDSLIYMAKFAEAVYVLHAFQKKSRKTARADVELARHRFRALVRERRQR